MLKVLTMYTQNYYDLFNKYWLKTIPTDIENIEIFKPDNLDLDANKLSNNGKPIENFKRLMYLKICWQLEVIKKNIGNNIFYIDGDIIFFNSFKDYINESLKYHDMILQNNNNDWNIGVWGIKCSDRVIILFEEIIPKIEELIYKDCSFEEQAVVNTYLKKYNQEYKVTIGTLPLGFFAGHIDKCKYPNFPNEKLYLYHATNTYSYDEKIKVLEDVNKRFSLGC